MRSVHYLVHLHSNRFLCSSLCLIQRHYRGSSLHPNEQHCHERLIRSHESDSEEAVWISYLSQSSFSLSSSRSLSSVFWASASIFCLSSFISLSLSSSWVLLSRSSLYLKTQIVLKSIGILTLDSGLKNLLSDV